MQEQENMEQNKPQQNPSFDPNQPVHHSVWIPVVVIAGLVVGYLALAGGNDWWPFAVSDERLATGDQEQQEQMADDLAGWQTYRNEEFGFEVKYPGDWNLKALSVSSIFLSPDDTNDKSFFVISPRGDTDFTFITDPLYKEVNVSGYMADWREWIISNNQLTVHTTFETYPSTWTRNNIIYIQTTESREIIDQIFSTLKFIKPAHNTSNWQTYRNEEFGFEVKHPINWEVARSGETTFIGYSEFREDRPEGGSSVGFEFKKQTTAEFIDEYNNSDLTVVGTSFSEIYEQVDYILNGIQAKRLTGTTRIGLDRNFIVIEREDGGLIISYDASDDFHNQILSTFRFLD